MSKSRESSRPSNKITRRRFLEGTAIVVAAPFVTTLAIRAGSNRPAPSERITMGLIGAGKRGGTLLGQFLGRKQVQVVAVAEVEATRRDHAKERIETRYAEDLKSGAFKGCKTHLDYRALIARDDIDAVIIATPDHWHALPVCASAVAKKDIYCEKPLSLTILEARVMADTVKKSEIVFQTGSQQRSEYGGKFHRACELVRNGRIGEVHTVSVGVGGPSKPCDLPEQKAPNAVDWNGWLGPAPYRGYHETLCPKGVHGHFPAWRSYREYSGGGFTDMGAHHFDIAQWGLGMDDSGPVEIIPPDDKDHPKLTYKYARGVTLVHGGPSGATFEGSEGTIYVDRGRLEVKPEGIDKEPIPEHGVKLYKCTNHVDNFLDCVRSRKDPICTAEIGCRSVTVCHLGNLAVWNKRRLKWDPEKYRFVGDDEANTWLDRPKRGDWEGVWRDFVG